MKVCVTIIEEHTGCVFVDAEDEADALKMVQALYENRDPAVLGEIAFNDEYEMETEELEYDVSEFYRPGSTYVNIAKDINGKLVVTRELVKD